jgi:tetratricopeptide (TPR) repeat protein
VKQWTQRIRFLVCVACLAIDVIGHTARADNSPESLFNRAVQLYRDGDTQGALTAFRGAYDATRNWKILYQIAETEFAQRNYVGAVQAYEQYLEEGRDTIDPTRRAEVTAEIRRLRARISSITVQTNVEGAAVALDEAR